MSNSVTNTKSPNGDGQSQSGQTARGDLKQTARVTVSAGQGREIFSQVNVSLRANLDNSDQLRRDKPASGKDRAEGEKTDWKSIKRGTDGAKTSEKQGTHSSESAENSPDKSAKQNNSAKSRNEMSRLPAESNQRNNNSQTQSVKTQNAANISTNESNQGRVRAESEQNIRSSPNASQNSSGRSSTQTRVLNLTIDFSIQNDLQNKSNSPQIRQNGFLGEVISQVFRESDVYLSRDAVKSLVEQHGENASSRPGNRTFESLPKQISQLVEAIENLVSQTPDRQRVGNENSLNRVSIEIPPELDDQIQSARKLFAQIFGTSDAKHFSRLNIQEKMLAAIEIFLKNLPAEISGNLKNHSLEKILAGFLLARGLICSDSRNGAENLLKMMQSAGSDKVSLAAMRDLGGSVKVLISDAAQAKSTVNLETAVQKFARILVAINCLDTLLTAVKLASQSQFAGGNVGRTLAIAQVYELINRLVLAGQNAMKDAAAQIADKNAAFGVEPDKNSRSVFPAKTVADLNEADEANRKNGESKNVSAENALRKFLEFNPLMVNDKFVSAFENSDDAQQAQKDFLDRHQIEIEQWLRGGNHRLVKDIDFEKPIGIVVERSKNDFFSATTARIVLVRDGSVQGWHFLKSFLVA